METIIAAPGCGIHRFAVRTRSMGSLDTANYENILLISIMEVTSFREKRGAREFNSSPQITAIDPFTSKNVESSSCFQDLGCLWLVAVHFWLPCHPGTRYHAFWGREVSRSRFNSMAPEFSATRIVAASGENDDDHWTCLANTDRVARGHSAHPDGLSC
jgi:hypothetical protein